MRDREKERERERRRRNTLFALSDRDFFYKIIRGPKGQKTVMEIGVKKPEECLGSCHTATIHTTMLRERQGRLRESRGDSDRSGLGHGQQQREGCKGSDGWSGSVWGSDVQSGCGGSDVVARLWREK